VLADQLSFERSKSQQPIGNTAEAQSGHLDERSGSVLYGSAAADPFVCFVPAFFSAI
jgi:hypothetical protein